MMGFDLEALRDVLRDDSLHIMLAVITQVAVAEDRSSCAVMVSVLPEQRSLICEMTWDAIGQEAGFFMLPNVGDLVLVGQAEGSKDYAYVLKRIVTKDEKIPVNAATGDIVMKAQPGKKAWITSDTRINLSKSDGAPTENLVLGQQLKTLLGQLITLVANHTHVGNLGAPTGPPQTASQISNLKSNSVDNDAILSTVAFTEKGS